MSELHIMQSVILTELGIIITKEQKIIKSLPFKNPAADYVKAKNGEDIDGLIEHITSSEDDFKVDRASLYDSLKKVSENMQMMSEKEIEDTRTSKINLMVDAGLARDPKDAISRLREFAVRLSSLKIAQRSESPDLHIIQAIGALDEIDRDINVKGARVREWYGLHFPELENAVDSINGYTRIALAGRRQDLAAETVEDAGFPPEKVEMILAAASNSRGGNITDENLGVVQELARQVLNLYGFRVRLEELVEATMKTMAPNVTAVLGATVGARILARAGSLKKLAMMPSSTIQILGAEKALFRSMRSGSQPPKHGLLFQHTSVHAAPRWQRGRIARAVAAKAAIAARVDLHQAGLNETLLEKLDVKIKEIGEKEEPVHKDDAGRREHSGGQSATKYDTAREGKKRKISRSDRERKISRSDKRYDTARSDRERKISRNDKRYDTVRNGKKYDTARSSKRRETSRDDQKPARAKRRTDEKPQRRDTRVISWRQQKRDSRTPSRQQNAKRMPARDTNRKRNERKRRFDKR